MKLNNFLYIPIFGILAFPLGARTWTNTRGKTVDAAWVRLDGDKVVMRSENGQEFRVPLNTLSAKDQEFVLRISDMEFMEKAHAWSLRQGKLVNAVLESADTRKITIVSKNGVKIRIPIADLSQDDKKYVLEQIKSGRVIIPEGEKAPQINTMTVDEFCTAIRDGDMNKVKIYIDHGGKLDVCSSDGNYTPLGIAAEYGNLEIAKLLLLSGANVDFHVMTNSKSSPLMIAVFRNKIELVKLFLPVGADVNYENADGNTVLMDSLQSRNIQIVKLLIAQGADVAYKTKKEGITVMDYARRINSSPEIIQLLEKTMLAKGVALPVAKSGILSENQEKSINEALQLLQTVNTENKLELIERVSLMRDALVKVKMGKGTINDPCPPLKCFGITLEPTPLELAASTGVWELVDKFLKLGADPSKRSDFARRQAFAALSPKGLKVLKCCFESGLVNENVRHIYYGNTLLIWTAVAGDYPEVVQYLLEKGCNINARNGFHSNVLHEAIQYKRIGIVRLLLQNKIDMRVVGIRNGEDALSIAKKYKTSPEIIKLLEEAEASQEKESSAFGISVPSDPSSPSGNAVPGFDDLMESIRQRDIPKITACCRAKVGLNQRDSYGATPLILAIRTLPLPVTRMLVEAGADVNYRGGGGWLPLLEAVYRNRPDIVRFLLNRGAGIKLKEGGKDGQTVLDVARKNNVNGSHYEVIQILEGFLKTQE